MSNDDLGLWLLCLSIYVLLNECTYWRIKHRIAKLEKQKESDK